MTELQRKTSGDNRGETQELGLNFYSGYEKRTEKSSGNGFSALKPITENIPDELKALDQWVCWKAEARDGKITKVPYDPKSGKKAKSNDPNTWGSFEKALGAYESSKFSGIGFEFSKHDGICGIDLDHCLNDAGEMEIWATCHVERFNSYTEKSPSGTGVHIIIMGKLPPGRRKKGNYEAYDRGRFFTFTGDIIGSPRPICGRQNELIAFHAEVFALEPQKPITPKQDHPHTNDLPDAELIKKAMNAGNGSLFARLWAGDFSGYPSSSEADLALSCLLAFWTGKDSSRMDRLFRASGLMRDKWDEKHYGTGQTYGDHTIQTAIAGVSETYDPKSSREGKFANSQNSQQEKNQSEFASSQNSQDKKIISSILPKTPYPWHVFPEKIRLSLQQLGRATASTATPLGGVALAYINSALGRLIHVQVKKSWKEPLIVWMGDVRDSGEGKTPPMIMLAEPLQEKQRAEHQRYDEELEHYESLTKKQRENLPLPASPLGYFATNVTLEGLRNELSGHPTGGFTVIYNELSEMISCQNQYKAKGSDREAWLKLHDGHDARIIRAKQTLYIHGARVQIVGGIQPKILVLIFGSDDGVFLVDGTVFRFLFTYEPAQHHELTNEEWTEENQAVWANTLNNALAFADFTDEGEGENLILTESAQEFFYKWRNDLDRQKMDLPPEIRGFLPKAYGYALRLAGSLYLLDRFSQGLSTVSVLTPKDIEKGIHLVMFHLGQVVTIMDMIKGEMPDSTRERILSALEEGEKTLTDFYRVFQNHITADVLNQKLTALEEEGLILPREENSEGKRKKIYSLRTCEFANSDDDEIEI